MDTATEVRIDRTIIVSGSFKAPDVLGDLAQAHKDGKLKYSQIFPNSVYGNMRASPVRVEKYTLRLTNLNATIDLTSFVPPAVALRFFLGEAREYMKEYDFSELSVGVVLDGKLNRLFFSRQNNSSSNSAFGFLIDDRFDLGGLQITRMQD